MDCFWVVVVGFFVAERCMWLLLLSCDGGVAIIVVGCCGYSAERKVILMSKIVAVLNSIVGNNDGDWEMRGVVI